MAVIDYRVRLDAFEGPLDLLLYLIRRSEVDIHDIPVGQITDQYLALLKADGGIERLDIEIAGEFLVMAATLMEIKSRLLSPRPAAAGAAGDDALGGLGELGAGSGDIDPRADLVQKLLAFKRYRDAAQMLTQRHAEWESRLPAGAAGVPDAPVDATAGGEDEPVHMEDIEIVDLVQAFSRIMETVDFARVGEHRVFDDETPIQLHAEDLLEQLKHAGEIGESASDRPEGVPVGAIELRRVFSGRTKSEAVGLFLAMLELIRQRKIAVRQDKIHDRIWIQAGEVV